jgi:CHAT domain-containing protein/tetratricopeptide (TPR) repeat protein
MVRTAGSLPRCIACAAFAASIGLATCAPAFAQKRAPPFVPPPRTIADITAILDQQKQDPKHLAKLRADAYAAPPAGLGPAALSKFYYDRANIRADLGRNSEALADALKGIEVGRGQIDLGDLARLRDMVVLQHMREGEPKKALPILFQNMREQERTLVLPGSPGRGSLFSNYRWISQIYLLLGDMAQAEAYVRRSQSRLAEARSWPGWPTYRMGWQVEVERAVGRLHEARGQFREAEAAYARGERLLRIWVVRRESLPNVSPRTQGEGGVDQLVAWQGRMKALQGRMAEGEADVRRALLSRLKSIGKYNTQTVQFITMLASLMVDQGRYADAEKLTRTAIEINRTLGVAEDSQSMAGTLNGLASILNLEGRWDEAAQVYAAVDAATKAWEPGRREALSLNVGHILTLFNTKNLEAGIAGAERLLARQKAVLGEKNPETAIVRGLLAIGLARAGRDPEAMREFELAIPVLLSASSESEGDDTASTAARAQRSRIVVEAYMALLARSEPVRGAEPVALETFVLAEAMRGRSVQRALAASTTRMLARDPALGELARKEQDLEKQVAAELGVLNNLLALPPEARDDKTVSALTTEIAALRTARTAARRDIEKRFPNYADLIDPKPPRVEDVRAVLKPGEAFLSFYFGQDISFVWAIPQVGPIAFASVPLSFGDADAKVKLLREPFEREAPTVRDIPAFDLTLAHELFTLLLKPVEAGWRSANSLIVVTNGALGLFPLGLLTTAAPTGEVRSDILFDGYRQVPWLARTHAVSQVPSAAALRTLRLLPLGSAKRERLIAFGDPYFSIEQAAEAARRPEGDVVEVGAAVRGLPFRRRATVRTAALDSAELARLPRLPDTADELRSVAEALEADPAKVLNLGRDANEQKVKATDLSRYRIIAFATHGLLPGDLNGLSQPALALTAPSVADVDGDGLLTMEEILALKLDADWVVLSACNTGAGAEAGAEAASGLGRAFFYAGSRALLVTNWSVYSAPARVLVTDLFRRQATDSSLGRAEALRRAMIAVMDGPGYAGEGNESFSYAHPIFWAPYTLIGDGGQQ